MASIGSLAHAEATPPAKSNEIGEVVVTAQKRSENIQKVPISIQAFTAKDIRALGIKSSSDLGQMSPNVDIALPAGAGNQPIIAIRGIGLNDYDTNNAGPNGVYVDEVYLSSPASQTFQTFDLQRVEVLKGPQGTLYGRNSSGGAINFISNKPTDYFTADLHAEYSSFNTFNVLAAVGGPIAPGLTGRIAIVKNDSEGYTTNALTGNKENGANNAAFRAMLEYKPNDQLKVLFNVHGGYVDNRPAEY
ncbi:MAG: TonB-dependent receptor plug domain-containing protein, partial [Caulobacteraceae bacterium]|nr:TonB-dependent receptor plug domain-containing protein [Caulobacteraceae bacterium]